MGLSTGLFEACSMSPQVAQIGRYYERAKFMTDLNWALLLGGTVIKKETWAQIPADIRPALLKAMQEAGAKLRRSGGIEKDVAAMKRPD
jgi:TRAP-type C4-dicarboxylate transport system substrate-binding protein